MSKEKKIEEIEKRYLTLFKDHFIRNKTSIIERIISMQIYKDYWIGFGEAVDNSIKSTIAVGTERVIHHFFASIPGGQVSSIPVGADLLFEFDDAMVHIDIKTVTLSNIGDFQKTIFISGNQTSYDTDILNKIKPNDPPIEYKPALPYEYVVDLFGSKLCVTLFLCFLFDSTNYPIVTYLVCLPNGQLRSYNDLFQRGKSKATGNHKADRVKDSARVILEKVMNFRHIHGTPLRLNLLHINHDLIKTNKVEEKLKLFTNLSRY